VFRRAPAVALAALVACAAPLAALAATVQVRVEGKTQTIFAPAPRAVQANHALDALEAASVAGEFYYHVTQFAFGPFVDQIGRHATTPADGWVFKVNGALPPVGADKVTLKDGDTVLWYWAPFTPTGAPTLELRRQGRTCYQAFAQDDEGRRTVAAGATLRVDGRSVRTTNGRACLPRRPTGLVRATLSGAIRSNAVR
jgi:Domain of unknown function (DUF4430)